MTKFHNRTDSKCEFYALRKYLNSSPHFLTKTKLLNQIDFDTHLDREIDKHLKPNVWVQRWEKSRNRELGVLLIDWFDDMDDTYGWSFGELVCVCCGASIGCVEYVVWDVVLTIFFSLSFSFLFLWQFGVFLFDFWLFLLKSKRLFFSEVKHVTRKTLC